jgi:hypothetical protein
MQIANEKIFLPYPSVGGVGAGRDDSRHGRERRGVECGVGAVGERGKR